jgi:leucyl aminopeptidase
MAIAFSAADQVPADAEVVAVPVFAGLHAPEGSPVALDLGFLEARGFEGKPGETQAIPTGDGRTVLAVGVGGRDAVDAEALRRAAAGMVRASWRATTVATTLLEAAPGLEPATAAQALAEGAALAAYTFTRYKSEAKPCRISRVTATGGQAEVQRGLDRGARVAEAVSLARDLVNEPAGAMTPRRLAEVATEMAEREGLQVSVLDEVAIAEQGLGGLLGVAAGSHEPPRLIELVYDPPDAEATVALVGKGITFDSGGLSIKNAEGMMTMKTDMSGAAAVIATLSALPAVAPPVKVVGLAPCTENMPGGGATRPGDVLRIRNGKTVEVLNTDAEGRLVLADALSLAAEAEPDAIVDLATLTGACVVALGREIAGLMGTDDDLVTQVQTAAERAGEPVWHLPLPDRYRKHLDSDAADVKNIGVQGQAGALAAGLFLREFAGGRPWVHLDIAGPARCESDEAYLTKGGTGFGVRTLLELLATFARPGPAPGTP